MRHILVGRRDSFWHGAAALAGAVTIAACTAGANLTPEDVTVETVPSAAHLVSGGDALVRITSRNGSALTGLDIQVNGINHTQDFKPAPPDWLGRNAPTVIGLVTGLKDGDNSLIVSSGNQKVAELTVTNYPIVGPIFSGVHLKPYFCLEDLAPDEGQPRRFAVGNGQFISGGKLDENCSLPTRVDYLYRTSGDKGDFVALDDPARLPPNAAQTTTSSGVTVPFVIRLQTGTVNRAIYQFAVLVDPDRPQPNPWAPPRGWNGRLVYTYGGGCEAGFFQGTSTGGVLRDAMLGKGYAVASSTLNVNAQGGCNDPLSAETTMMVKEKFAETIGPPVHTIGSGGSGGAMQQLLIAGAYPGILDGIMPSATFPDAVTYFIDTEECRLPLRRYLNAAKVDDETRRVIGGWATWDTCEKSLGPRTNRIAPDDCPDDVPRSALYHPVNNPTGLRCSIYDAMRSVFGTKRYDEIKPAPSMPFGRSPHDNIGVQYGLEALNQGRISKELFLDLNEKVGGWDIDYKWRPARTQADPEVVRIAYETGRITSGTGGLAVTPIMDERGYLDKTGNFHASYYSFVMRERLIRDAGHADNYILQRRPSSSSRASENLALMDEWLSHLGRDQGAGERAAKIVRNRPQALAESCWTEDGTEIREPQVFDKARLFDNNEGRCNTIYPPHTGPRMVAGGPLTNDVLKCQLKPLNRSEYKVPLTDREWTRLQQIFPGGVCDWSKPGVGQVPQTRTWLSFGPSPVNRYTAPAAATN
jgi:Tannase-like family of unknown function (DUF6351)